MKLIIKKEAQINILITILIVALFLFVLFWSTNNDINYGISLIDNEIEEGTDALLHYEIKNGWLSGQKDNVKFKYYIKDRTVEQIISFGDMDLGQTEEGTVELPTSSLSPNKYTVWTILEYKINGIVHTKELGLELTIY